MKDTLCDDAKGANYEKMSGPLRRRTQARRSHGQTRGFRYSASDQNPLLRQGGPLESVRVGEAHR